VLNSKRVSLTKFSDKLKGLRLEIRYYSYTNRCASCKKANRTNSTFGFCRHSMPTLQKPKELFLATLKKRKQLSIQ